MPAAFLCFFKDEQCVRYSRTFGQIVTKVQMQMLVPAISFDDDPSYNFCHDNFFTWWVDRYRDNGRNLDVLLNPLDEPHVTVQISDSLHLGKNFCSGLLKYIPMGSTTNGVRPVNLSLMNAVPGMMPTLSDVSRFGKMRDIYPIMIFRMQNIVILLRNVMIVDAAALLPMALFLTTLRLERVALDARMDILQMSFCLFLCMFQEYKVPIDQGRQPPEVGSVNDRVIHLTKDALIRHLNTLLAIIWLFRDASDVALDRLSRHPVENFFGLPRRIIHDVNTFNQMLKATADMCLMNEGIEILSKEGDPDVRPTPTRMNMAGVKIRKAQMDKQQSSWFTARIKNPNAVADVCLRACRHSEDIYRNDRLEFDEFSGYIEQLALFVRTSNLANEGNCTFAATSGSRIMDMDMAHSAKV
jgi:hypothetical protein